MSLAAYVKGAPMYVYCQLEGGEETWEPIRTTQLDALAKKPTFVTVLALDTLIVEGMQREDIIKIKYAGPLYFDFDSDDVVASVAGVKVLLTKLDELGLTEDDYDIFLSGKKGVHVLVPEQVFMEKPAACKHLPLIYKEMAFTLAVDTMDFRVYTAKKGRQFRTTHNVRENGNYKVAVTRAELGSIETGENYNALCKSQKHSVRVGNPTFRPKLGLVYDVAAQKADRVKVKPTKSLTPNQLAEQLPLFTKVANGEGNNSQGFNITAMQLALYAREAEWSEERLVAACTNVINNHQSDGSRYNSPSRRERELRRMYAYVSDNPTFEYSAAGLKACQAKAAPSEEDYEAEGSAFHETPDFAGVSRGAYSYLAAKGDDGEVPITNFVFKDVTILRLPATDEIVSIRAGFCQSGKKLKPISLTPNTLTGGTSLQNAVAPFGGSFSGTDIHARGVYQAMLKEVNKDAYVVDSEGVNLFQVGTGSTRKEAFVVWADREGIKASVNFADLGYSVEFQGYPDPRGVVKTDLLAAPTLEKLLETQDGLNSFIVTLKAFVNCQTPEVIGKMLGWAVACFYAPLFQHKFGKFPLLHVYGPAGSGKTETIRGLLRLFYFREAATETGPNSSVFALIQMMAGSSSIPIFFDEYKPHRMAQEKLEQYRSIFRDAYNAKSISKGGGNKGNSHYSALQQTALAAPLLFAGEAPETETAIVERSVMVSFKRLQGLAQTKAFASALAYYADTEAMASLGLELASKVVAENNADISLELFEKAHKWACEKYLPRADDYEKVERGEMTLSEAQVRASMRPRTVYNNCVSFFGIQIIKRMLLELLGREAYDEHFGQRFSDMGKAIFVGMDGLSAVTQPEYIKLLSAMADMTVLDLNDSNRLVGNFEYSLSELGGKPVLVVALRQAYRKYRGYMRATNLAPLYPSEESVLMALREVPQFLQTSNGTKNLDTECYVFDLEALQRAGMPSWSGKVVDLFV